MSSSGVVITTLCSRMLMQDAKVYEGVVHEVKSKLTKNQKHKRRKKLSKLYKKVDIRQEENHKGAKEAPSLQVEVSQDVSASGAVVVTSELATLSHHDVDGGCEGDVVSENIAWQDRTTPMISSSHAPSCHAGSLVRGQVRVCALEARRLPHTLSGLPLSGLPYLPRKSWLGREDLSVLAQLMPRASYDPQECHVCRVDMSTVMASLSSQLSAGTEDEAHAQEGDVVMQPTAAAPLNQCSLKRALKRAYVYGNYDKYYGYRAVKGEEDDPRVQVLNPAWIKGRRCLDVGCNEGVVTLQVVTKLFPYTMKGVDLDPDLIAKAAKHLKATRSRWTDCLQEMTGAVASTPCQERDIGKVSRTIRALKKVKFHSEEWVHNRGSSQCVDTILCFSVSKWIHLNWGDEGLEKFFRKCYRSLTPGGYLVLEPQPWKSYRGAILKVGTRSFPFTLEQLKLRPEDFLTFLVERVGFLVVASLEVKPSGKGFDRPVYVLQRPA